MDENFLFADVAMLNEVAGRKKSRDIQRKRSGIIPKEASGKRWELLLEATQKFGIPFKYMPPMMKKRRMNTSSYNIREDSISWRIEWCFDQIRRNKLPLVATNTKVKDTQILETVLKSLVTNPEYVNNYASYLSTEEDIGKWVILFKVDILTQEGREKRFCDVPKDKSLREALKGKAIVEFPTFHVTLPTHLKQYNLASERDLECSRKMFKEFENGLPDSYESEFSEEEEEANELIEFLQSAVNRDIDQSITN
eukprot:TRINITY_DN2262_c0_g2_i2.p1 TRINITY_DN2262_c0_g2~~TRINITY_DN2262_c0_g2_i2.p1  ORF type:complete len:253 (+),score=57.43 TRINITY_DN2262_c0_g2_i2:374-1132(+)